MRERGHRIRAGMMGVLLLFAAASAHAGDDVAALVAKADLAYRGKTAAGVFTMHIKSSSYERSYSVVVWSDDRDDRARALVKILGPALWRGSGTLKVGNQLKLFDPKTNYVTVVNSSMLGDSWMGSHFSNDDLVKETRLADDYRVTLNKRWQGESALGAGTTFYRVRLTPKPSAPVAWAHIIYTLAERGSDVIPIRAEYFRKRGQARPSRVITFSQVKKLGGKMLPAAMEVTVADKPGELTRIVYKRLELGVSIPSGKFTERSLRK